MTDAGKGVDFAIDLLLVILGTQLDLFCREISQIPSCNLCLLMAYDRPSNRLRALTTSPKPPLPYEIVRRLFLRESLLTKNSTSSKSVRYRDSLGAPAWFAPEKYDPTLMGDEPRTSFGLNAPMQEKPEEPVISALTG